MNPSTELKNAVLRLYECISLGDVGAVQHLFSQQDGVLAIGSDPNEWWADYDMITQAFKAQLQEGGARQIEAGELNAYVEGTVGWAADRRTIRLNNGKEITIRETSVFHKEDGEWKIVQLHASLGIPNEEAFGKEPAVK
jgi:adenylate cyclase